MLCFVAGTHVLLPDGRTVPIERIQAGDAVASEDDPAVDDGCEIGTVRRVFKNVTDTVLSLHLADEEGTGVVTATPEHPFYVPDQGAYVPATEIPEGTTILGYGGARGVLKKKVAQRGYFEVYNLEVEDQHNYYVVQNGVGPVLTHNMCFNPRQLQAKWKHAVDFGVTGQFNHRRLKEYEEAILRHISQADVVMPGTYRNTIPVKHYLQRNTGLWVCEDLSGNYITGWTLPPHKVTRLINTGDVK